MAAAQMEVPEQCFAEGDIAGRYHMGRNGTTPLWFAEPDLLPDMFFHRTYEFGHRNRFEVHYIFFSDENCTMPLVSAIWEGRYWLLEPHSKLPHARLANYRLDRVKMAILDPTFLQETLDAGLDHWTLGLFRDISETGFASLGPLFEPLRREHTDYDIVYLHDGVLKTGLRTTAMMLSAAGRPSAFQDALPAIRE